MIKIAICDDAISCIADLKKIIQEYNMGGEEYMIYEYLKGKDLLRDMCKEKFDIVLMDVELEKENGIEIADQIKKIDRSVILLYASFYNIYFQEMVKTEPFGFIDKTAPHKKIFHTLDRVMERLEIIKREKRFLFSYNGKNHIIDLNDVVFFSSEHKVIHIKMEDREYRFYGKLDDVQKDVDKAHPLFARISKSYLINVLYLDNYGSREVKINGENLTVTEKYREGYILKLHKLLE